MFEWTEEESERLQPVFAVLIIVVVVLIIVVRVDRGDTACDTQLL